jgi:flagellar motor switch protein FliG
MKTGDAKMAATLFILMGEEAAANVLKFLNESEIEKISREISNVETLMMDDSEQSAEELYRLLVANNFASQGGLDYAKKIILKSLGAGSAKRIIDRLSSKQLNGTAFEAIERLNPFQLSQFMQNEHPQTIALILAHLTPSRSAELLGTLPKEMQAEVTVRMASLDAISPDVIRGISAVLEEKLKPASTDMHSQSYDGLRAVAELLNRLERSQSRAVLEKIESDKPEVANSIRQLMFIFEDVATLDDPAIRAILQRVDKKTVARALKGTSDSIQAQFFKNMSARAVEMMQEEIEIMGPVKMRDVHAAQHKIVEIVRELEEDGVITIGGGDHYVV